jgi:hypothetical protein
VDAGDSTDISTAEPATAEPANRGLLLQDNGNLLGEKTFEGVKLFLLNLAFPTLTGVFDSVRIGLEGFSAELLVRSFFDAVEISSSSFLPNLVLFHLKFLPHPINRWYVHHDHKRA